MYKVQMFSTPKVKEHIVNASVESGTVLYTDNITVLKE